MSDKKRINQIAKETGLKNADLVSAAQELGLAVKAHSSSVTDAEAEKIIARVKSGTTATEKTAAPAKDTQSKAKTSKKKDDAAYLKAGTAVSVLETKLISTGNLWARIPSGWFCVWEYEKDKLFIK